VGFFLEVSVVVVMGFLMFEVLLLLLVISQYSFLLPRKVRGQSVDLLDLLFVHHLDYSFYYFRLILLNLQKYLSISLV
jgi:hypothetical protein